VKVNRAEELLDELRQLVGLYGHQHFQPIRARMVVQPDEGFFRVDRLIPVQTYGPHTAVIGDVVHNLRSALDHLAWQLVEASGGTPRDRPGEPQTAFPIRTEAPRNGLRIHGDVAPPALKVVETLQPYNVLPESPADADLWHLHRLDIIDKHHGLLLAPARHEAVTWGTPGEYDGQLVIDRFSDDGAEYRFVPDRPSETGARAEMSLLVALGPGLPGAGLPVVTRLRELLALVRDDVCPALFPYL
jgi:hypothetical protein